MLQHLIHYTRTSLFDPREAVRQAMRAPYSTPEVMWIGITSVVLSVLISQIAFFLRFGAAVPTLDGEGTPPFVVMIISNPLMLTALYVLFYGLALAIAGRFGTMVGGQASNHEAIIAVTLSVVIGLVVNTIEALLLVLFTPFAPLFALAASIWLFYLLAVFIAEAHKFENLVAVMGGIVVSMFGAVLILTLFLAMFGLAA